MAAVVLLQTAKLAAQNLAANPGFETGNTSGWFGFGSPTISAVTSPIHSGIYSALVTNRTASFMGIAQSFQGVIATNQAYNVSAWVQLSEGASQTVQITAQKIDGGGTSYTAIASGSISAGTWTQLSGQYTLSTSGTLSGLTFYVEVPGSSNAAYFIDDFSVAAPASTLTNGSCTVDWTNVFQRIDGFGASSAWNSSITAAQADLFFSTNTGAGLSFLRSRIAPGGGTVESGIMMLAQARGARVWSSPWSPPTTFKTVNSLGTLNVNGGDFVGNPANYQAYASQLAGYVASMKSFYGISLYALSIQNEPDTITTSYESCGWTGQQFHDFIPYLSSALLASNVAATKIMLPESLSWSGNTGLYTTAMNDAAVAPLVGIVANHNYDGANFNTGPTNPPAAINSYGKALWETEVSTGDAFDGSISNAIYWAGRVHQYMTVAQANAWHYWWLISTGSDNQGLTDNSGNVAKRLYALGQFSRFVRPNFYRIGVTNVGQLVQISSYKDLTNGSFAIVAINSANSNISQVFNLTNFAATSITPWVTSATLSLASQTPISVTGNSFTSTLPAMSIVTFVGKAVASNTAPSLVPISDQTINPGFTLRLTNNATDSDLPPQTLSFSLLAGPTNSALNSVSGVFTWRPLVSQAGTTNAVSVRVSDTGSPIMSATNNFKIKVNILSQPALNSITLTNGFARILASGTTGPDYTLLTSTNLVNWQPVVTSNSPTLPVVLTDTNAFGTQRYFRIKVGP